MNIYVCYYNDCRQGDGNVLEVFFQIKNAEEYLLKEIQRSLSDRDIPFDLIDLKKNFKKTHTFEDDVIKFSIIKFTK